MTINFFCPHLRHSSPTNQRLQNDVVLNLFGFSGLVEVSYSPKSGCCNVDSSYLDLGVLFLVGIATRVEILPQKCFLKSSMAKTSEAVVNSFLPRVNSGRLLRSSQNIAGTILPS